MRVAVIGSSHVGAIKEALPQIRAAYPTVRLDFFAVPGGVFRRCVLRGEVFRTKPQSDAEAAMILQVNGTLSCDVADHDHIWVVGYRFAYGAVLQAWINNNDPQTEMLAALGESVERIATQFGPDRRITLTPAPYPSLRTRAPGPKHEMRMARIQRHPERDAIFTAYETALTQFVKTAGYHCVLQPADTRAAPFATDNRFLIGAKDFQHGQPLQGDLRHMNHSYGRAVFAAFAEQRLGLMPETSG
ncbi:hypothetical protein SAMN04488515_0129 [Cognatiyoonia koreensis]|uniref:SGNH/GDSL hydrolase family protein n=1 Tax=Cognatiyoonia koreensis TaxID=364200 RepID=A0A1I0MNQ9_9RHOB|nr:hypothetical protein [Cognatiyoonia koreensis]SEV89854.1 hypothetical protein SAMN04488515_0129 [Cognatiyoonia koreensis]